MGKLRNANCELQINALSGTTSGIRKQAARLRIALISPYDLAYPGGVTEHITALARGLHQKGHSVVVLGPYSTKQHSQLPLLKPLTRHVVCIPVAGTIARIGVSVTAYHRLKRVLQQQQFDVVHLQEPLTPGITWWALTLVKRYTEAVTIGTFHAYHEYPGRLYRLGRPVLHKLFQKLDGLIAVSEAAQQFSNRRFPGRYRIIPNGIDITRFNHPARGTYPSLSRGITILFVGREDQRKGFDTLFQAFVQLKSAHLNLQLLVVGPFSGRTQKHYLHLGPNPESNGRYIYGLYTTRSITGILPSG